jgi:glyoxylase I family protein
MIKGFHHPGIVVPDLENAIRFYTELFNMKIVREHEWDESSHFNKIIGLDRSSAKYCFLKGANCYLELFQYSSPASDVKPGELNANDTGIRHLCFLVEDVAQVQDKLTQLGGSIINEPVDTPGIATAAYCRDPFGNLLEFIAPVGDFPPSNKY